jgi:hypothetical protein
MIFITKKTNMQNFGKIKNAFNGILAESMFSKNDTNKLLFKKYIKTIKESDILRTQFLVYNNIETKLGNEGTSVFAANVYISENLRLLEKYKVSDILKENQKLVALSEAITNNLSNDYDPRLSSLHESISNLIFTKRNAKSVETITESLVNVVEYIKSNKVKTLSEAIELPTSMLTTMMVDKYNEKYASLDESEKKLLKVLIDSTPEEKSSVYSETIRECIDLINEKLSGSDLEAKDKLLRVKDKLLNDKIDINEEFEKKISKLVELKNSLK